MKKRRMTTEEAIAEAMPLVEAGLIEWVHDADEEPTIHLTELGRRWVEQVVSIHLAEFRRRLARGEDVEATKEWFIDSVAEMPNAGSFLSDDFEFLMGIHTAFTRWRRRGIN